MKDMTSTEKEQLRELNHKDRRARTCAKLNLEEATHSGRQMQALIPILVKEFETRTFDHNSMIKHMETIEQEARRILESVLRAKSKVLEAQEALEQGTKQWKESPNNPKNKMPLRPIGKVVTLKPIKTMR